MPQVLVYVWKCLSLCELYGSLKVCRYLKLGWGRFAVSRCQELGQSFVHDRVWMQRSIWTVVVWFCGLQLRWGGWTWRMGNRASVRVGYWRQSSTAIPDSWWAFCQVTSRPSRILIYLVATGKLQNWIRLSIDVTIFQELPQDAASTSIYPPTMLLPIPNPYILRSRTPSPNLQIRTRNINGLSQAQTPYFLNVIRASRLRAKQ